MRLFKQIPSSWIETSLGVVCSFVQYGLNAKTVDTAQDGVFYLRISDIDNEGQVNKKNRKYVSISEDDLEKYCLKDGDLVIARSGSVGRSYVYHQSDNPWVFASYLIRFRPEQNVVLSDFLGFYMKSAFYWHYIDMVTRVVAQPNINSQELKNLPIVLPPLSEQQEIVEILREADTLQQLRKQADKHTQDLIPALFAKMFPDFQNYTKQKLSRICNPIANGTTPKASEIFDVIQQDTDVPFLKVSHIDENGLINFSDSPSYISEDLHNGLLGRSKVYPSDILMNIVGPPLGLVGFVLDNFEEWNINQNIALFRANENYVTPFYLYYAMQSPRILPRLIAQATGVRQLYLGLEKCRNFEIPVPSLSLQLEFSRYVEDIREILVSQKNATNEVESLNNSLLARAFTGELTREFRLKNQSQLEPEAQERDIALGLIKQKEIVFDLSDIEQNRGLTRSIAQQLPLTLSELTNAVIDETPVMNRSSVALAQMVEEVIPALPDKNGQLFIIIDSLFQNVQHGLRQQFVDSAELIKQRLLPFYQEQFDTKAVLEMLLTSASKIRTLKARTPQSKRVVRTNSRCVDNIDNRLETLLKVIEQRPPYFRAFDLVHNDMGLAEVTSSLNVLLALGFIRRVVWEPNLDAIFRLVDPSHPDDYVPVDSEES